jgi:hypothetical protein
MNPKYQYEFFGKKSSDMDKKRIHTEVYSDIGDDGNLAIYIRNKNNHYIYSSYIPFRGKSTSEVESQFYYAVNIVKKLGINNFILYINYNHSLNDEMINFLNNTFNRVAVLTLGKIFCGQLGYRVTSELLHLAIEYKIYTFKIINLSNKKTLNVLADEIIHSFYNKSVYISIFTILNNNENLEDRHFMFNVLDEDFHDFPLMNEHKSFSPIYKINRGIIQDKKNMIFREHAMSELQKQKEDLLKQEKINSYKLKEILAEPLIFNNEDEEI